MTYSWRERRGKTLHRLLIFEDESIGWLWLIVDISIVKGYIYISYKPSYITGGPHLVIRQQFPSCLAISLLCFVRSKAFSWKMSWRTSKPWIDMIEMVHIHDFSDPCPRYLTEFLGTPIQGSAFPMFLFKYEYHVRIPQFYGKLTGLRPWVSGSPIFRGPVINAKELRDLITAKTHNPVISSITPHQLVASTGLIVYTVYIYIIYPCFCSWKFQESQEFLLVKPQIFSFQPRSGRAKNTGLAHYHLEHWEEVFEMSIDRWLARFRVS